VADELHTRLIEPEWAEQLEALERRCFPSIPPDELYNAAMLRNLAIDFPEGNYVVFAGDEPVAMGLGVRVDFDIDNYQHTWDDLFGKTEESGDNPAGEWYYGTDISVDPAYRRRGIGRDLYERRKQVCRDLNLRGIIAGGVIPGYAEHKHEMSAATYVEKVVAGELYDGTLSFQLENGFEARGVLAGYLEDPTTDSWASFIVWPNPDFVAH